MVLPTGGTGELRVRIVRDSSGRVVGFQDPDNRNQFIARSDAVDRVRYNTEAAQIEDSFGNNVGVAALALPGRGVTVGYKNGATVYKSFQGDITGFDPQPNQEIVERVIFINQDGTLRVVNISYGYGQKYDPASKAAGGLWARGAADALGLKEGERLPTTDLKQAEVLREFIIKTSSF